MKLYRTSIYCIPATEEPEWENGATRDFFQVTNKPIPPEITGTGEAWHVIHCSEGTEPPTNCAAIVVEGHKTPWTADAVAAGWPNGHPYVMDATWMATGPIGEHIVRGKMVDVPAGVMPIDTLLVPHEWAGDGA